MAKAGKIYGSFYNFFFYSAVTVSLNFYFSFHSFRLCLKLSKHFLLEILEL